MQPAFDSFSRPLEHDEWVPIVQQLKQAAFDDPQSLDSLLDDYPSVRHYRIFGMIGRGAMAKVFGAWDVEKARPVAIKLFEPKHEEVWSLIRRFQNEADAMSKLKHPNIASLLDRGNKRGRVYIVMNLIVGSPLSSLVKHWQQRYGIETPVANSTHLFASSTSIPMTDSGSVTALLDRPPRSESRLFEPALHSRFRDVEPFSDEHFQIVAEIGRDMCDALGYSHRQRILHRDVKPSNLLVDEHGKVWITDFGLANFDWRSNLDSTDQRLTQCGDLLGTIAYMSVGAVDGNYSEQSDLYSLGVTLFELTTLTPIWDRQSDNEILRGLFDNTPPPLIDHRFEQVPQDLAKTINCLLNAELSPHKPTANQLRHSFASLAQGQPVVLPKGSTGIGIQSQRLIRRWLKPNKVKNLVILWLLLVTAFATVLGVRQYGQHTLDKAMADSIHASAQERVNQAVNSVRLLKQFTENVSTIDESSFASLARPMLENNSAVLAISYAETVEHQQRSVFEQFLQIKYPAAFDSPESNRVADAQRYLPVTQIEPASIQSETMGSDLLSDPRRREAIKQTEFTSGVAIAGPIDFLDQDLKRQGFALIQRVDRQGEPTSFVEVLFRFDDIMKHLKLPTYDDRMFVRVQPESLIAAEPIFQGDQDGVPFQIPAADPDFEYQLNIGSNHWSLEVSRANPWQRSNASWLLGTAVFALVLPIPMVLFSRLFDWILK